MRSNSKPGRESPESRHVQQSKIVTPYRAMIAGGIVAIAVGIISLVNKETSGVIDTPDHTKTPSVPLSTLPVTPPIQPAPAFVHPMFAEVTKNRNSKKHNYVLDGIAFASDTIPHEVMQATLEAAQAKIGGPYWKPTQKLVVEFAQVPVSMTDPSTFDVITIPQALEHELCHVLLGSQQDQWAGILAEFFANSASPEKEAGAEWHYNPTDTNIAAIQMRHPNFIRASQNNYFFDVRKFTLMALSKSMTNEARRAMVRDAFEQGTISFDQLHGFMKRYGMDHAIFRKGTSGHHLGAFKSLASPGGGAPLDQMLLLVSYDSYGEGSEMNEKPHPISLTLVSKDAFGTQMGASIIFAEWGLHLINIEQFLIGNIGEEKRKSVAFIEIPEMHQTITVNQASGEAVQ